MSTMSAFVFGKVLRPVAGRRFGGMCMRSRCAVNTIVRGVVPVQQTRYFGAAASKVAKTLTAEAKHEEEQYEQPKDLKTFLKNTPFTFVESQGDVNMMLERDIGDKNVRIEWQLSSPYDPNTEDGEDVEMEETTPLWVTVESKSSGMGLTFNCSTQAGEDHRYVIGNVKSFANAEEKESASSYNGPDFEDLDDKLQEGLDEYLAELGMTSEVCDFVDAMALDKEQREYVRWLKSAKEFLES
mmetsp:Transcript_15891/g.25270  ORF Transcript_15891/g.25270 Transcript_15891/m.25270 type:complete len:241 (-) Transcript_15891:122-844(-)